MCGGNFGKYKTLIVLGTPWNLSNPPILVANYVLRTSWVLRHVKSGTGVEVCSALQPVIIDYRTLGDVCKSVTGPLTGAGKQVAAESSATYSKAVYSELNAFVLLKACCACAKIGR